MNLRKPLLRWLKAQTEDPRKSMSHFTGGGFLFAGGMMILILSEQLLDPSLKQELIALFGVMVIGLGLILALWGYLSISLFKILIYLFEQKDD